MGGTLVKTWEHLAIDIYMKDKNTIKVEKWFGKKKQLAAVRTVCSHIKNMFKGVTLGFLYKIEPCTLTSPSPAPSLRAAPSLTSETSWERVHPSRENGPRSHRREQQGAEGRADPDRKLHRRRVPVRCPHPAVHHR